MFREWSAWGLAQEQIDEWRKPMIDQGDLEWEMEQKKSKQEKLEERWTEGIETPESP